jgi:hypothetical protein
MIRPWFAAAVATLIVSAACKPESARRADRAAKETLARREQLHAAAARLGTSSDVVGSAANVLHETGELARAAHEFELRRAARITALRAQLRVIASQPPLIGTMAAHLPLTDAARAAINDKLVRLESRVDEATNLIEGLENVYIDAWEQRDSEVTGAMQHLDDARKDAWHALERAPHITRSSS